MPDKAGDYKVRVGGADVAFWPLTTGSTIASATPPVAPPPVAPNIGNVVVLPPVFGIFDILIAFTDEPFTRTAIAAPVLATQVTGVPTVTTMPLELGADGMSRICFAARLAAGATEFSGTLRLTAARTTPAANATLDLPIKVAASTLVNNLFVFFIVRPASTPPRTYAWVKLKCVEQTNTATAVGAASVTCKILRDNLTYKNINRRVALTTAADGYIGSSGRGVLGLPINWPIIFNATKASYVPRGHMIRLASGDIHDNLAPHEPAVALQMTRTADASLAAKTVLLDAGHGVVYSLTSARRSQEWFVAHKVLDRIAAILTAEHAMPAANILRTRTAGIGLIEPTSMTSNGAPETGDGRYELDLVNRRIRVRLNSLGLLNISDLVLTTHTGAANTAAAVAAADRTRLLTVNAATLATITTRLNASHGPSRQVRAGSIRWDAATSRYVYTHEPVATPGVGGTDAALPIQTGDWFTLDDAMFRVLAERSARWSLANEIGSGPAATAARLSFTDAARAAMAAAGALDYMRDKILFYLNVTAPHAYLSNGTKAWGPTPRMNFMNTNAHDLSMTLHENAGGGKGGMCLISGLGGADAPPDDQIRIGKIFAKYLDGFDQGLRQGGVTEELATNPVGMLHAGNHVRAKYAYFELEFMDADHPTDPAKFRYDQMVTGTFVDDVARQIVNGIVEVLLNRQSDLDAVTLNSDFTLW